MLHLLSQFLTAVLAVHLSGEPVSTWHCNLVSNTSLAQSVSWTKLNCTGDVHREPPFPGSLRVGPVIVNIASAELSQAPSSPKLRPAIARTALGLAPLHELAATAETPEFKPLAGVNGGYFFEVNRDDFVDDVCWGKLRRDALHNVSLSDPNAGIGDGLTIMEGRYVSSNCDKHGNSKPVAAVLDYPPHFVKLERAGRLPDGVVWAIAAGPNLVSRNASSGISSIDIEGDNINILGHASSTALAIRGREFLLVTVDAICESVEYKPTCGVDAWQFAAFLLDHMGVDSAMRMDGGGSTAMWVAGQPSEGIVSNPGRGERQIFNGIFIGT
jgi:hypothetical protein